jgi:hypothetical protein
MRSYTRRGYGARGGSGLAARWTFRLVTWALAAVALCCLITAPSQTAASLHQVISAVSTFVRQL